MKLAAALTAIALTLGGPAAGQTSAAGAPAAAAETVTIIHAGTLLAEPGKATRRGVSVVIRGRKIAELRDGFVEVPGARVVDLRNSTVLPGFIDSHVHLRSHNDPLTARLRGAEWDKEDHAFIAMTNARATLLAGFTTVRDLNGDPRLITSLRDAINDGMFAGPTILASGRAVGVTGGHGSGVPGLNRDLTAVAMEEATGMCDGPDACRRAVRLQVASGADVIKINATGGVLSNVAGGLGQQMTEPETRAVVETARSFGRKVAAHAHSAEGINSALRAGVDSIEHGTFGNEDSYRLFRQTGAYYVPTLLASVASLRNAARGAFTAAQVQKTQEAAGQAKVKLATALRAGVKIAFGTDSGVSPHGRNGEEFALLVEGGMSPADAIRAATVGAADLLGRSDSIGTIAPGKDADIVAVTGDPLANIRLLENVQFVMKHGRVHKLGGERQATEVD